jgi:hypothetical protein
VIDEREAWKSYSSIKINGTTNEALKRRYPEKPMIEVPEL